MLDHYYLEDWSSGQLYKHKASVNMVTWDVDTNSGFVWCNFSRYLQSENKVLIIMDFFRSIFSRNIWELDLTANLYQFYFIGMMDDHG